MTQCQELCLSLLSQLNKKKSISFIFNIAAIQQQHRYGEESSCFEALLILSVANVIGRSFDVVPLSPRKRTEFIAAPQIKASRSRLAYPEKEELCCLFFASFL